MVNLSRVDIKAELRKHLEHRILLLQRKHNFDINSGLNQVGNSRELARDFGAFQELIKLAEKFKLDVIIPHDPNGLTPESNLTTRKTRPTFVYFCREIPDLTVWKIGYSIAPFVRNDALQNGNSRPIEMHLQIPGGRDLEQLIHSHLRNFKTRHRSKKRGEWFRVSEKTIRSIIKRIQEEGTSFLLSPIENENDQEN